ncbi:hypothetical protein HN51_015022 [Arachis hypogaea]
MTWLYIGTTYTFGDDLLNENDLVKASNFSNYWKGKNNLYCVRLAHRGFFGASNDAQNVANNIASLLN